MIFQPPLGIFKIQKLFLTGICFLILWCLVVVSLICGFFYFCVYISEKSMSHCIMCGG